MIQGQDYVVALTFWLRRRRSWVSCEAKVIIYKSRGEPFLWNRIWDLGWFLGCLAVLKSAQCKLKYATLRVFFYVCMGKPLWVALIKISHRATYRKVASNTPVYYSILNSFGKRSQYISIKFPLHKQSENLWMCY